MSLDSLEFGLFGENKYVFYLDQAHIIQRSLSCPGILKFKSHKIPISDRCISIVNVDM